MTLEHHRQVPASSELDSDSATQTGKEERENMETGEEDGGVMNSRQLEGVGNSKGSLARYITGEKSRVWETERWRRGGGGS